MKYILAITIESLIILILGFYLLIASEGNFIFGFVVLVPLIFVIFVIINLILLIIEKFILKRSYKNLEFIVGTITIFVVFVILYYIGTFKDNRIKQTRQLNNINSNYNIPLE